MTHNIGWPVVVDMALIRTREKAILELLSKEFDWLQELLNGDTPAVLSEDLQNAARQRMSELANEDAILKELPATSTTLHQTILLQNLLDETFGFGPLGPVLRDPTVADIWVNGPDAVYVEREGHLERTTVAFENVEHLMVTIRKVLKPLGYELSEATPAIQATLPNGSLVIAALPPKGATQNGPVFIMRANQL